MVIFQDLVIWGFRNGHWVCKISSDYVGKTFGKGDYRPIDEGFWEDLINEGIEEIGTRVLRMVYGHDLAEQFGFLGSNQKKEIQSF